MSDKYISAQALEALNAESRQMEDERLRVLRARLAEAKANCPKDKEPFSITVFEQLYDLTDGGDYPEISQATIENLEIQYYLDNPNLKSLKEFASYREELDGNDVG